jgi:hypothetical protein
MWEYIISEQANIFCEVTLQAKNQFFTMQALQKAHLPQNLASYSEW